MTNLRDTIFVNWIKCSDQMPKKDELVIGWDQQHKQMFLGSFSIFQNGKVYWLDQRGFNQGNVTHWMECPNQPEH